MYYYIQPKRDKGSEYEKQPTFSHSKYVDIQ